jgi:nucleoside-diphosphate-sugar epimerase
VPERVFVTGALGFIGRSLADRYRADGAEIRGVDVRTEPERGVVAGDVSKAGAWQDHAAGCDLVIHTAALLSLGGDPDEFWGVNVVGTRRALDAAVRAGARRFVHFSSVLAFSPRFPDGVDERHPVRTNGMPYVDTKVASEQVVLQAHASGEIDCTIVRPGDVYGPRSRPWTIIPVEQIGSGLMGALPRGVFSPVYVDNLVDGVVLAAAGPPGQIYILSDGRGVANEEFFGHYFRMLGKRGPRTLPGSLLRGLAWALDHGSRALGRENELNTGAITYLSRTGTYSIEKARRELGYEPKIDLDEGMRRTEAWLRAEGMLG